MCAPMRAATLANMRSSGLQDRGYHRGFATGRRRVRRADHKLVAARREAGRLPRRILGAVGWPHPGTNRAGRRACDVRGPDEREAGRRPQREMWRQSSHRRGSLAEPSSPASRASARSGDELVSQLAAPRQSAVGLNNGHAFDLKQLTHIAHRIAAADRSHGLDVVTRLQDRPPSGLHDSERFNPHSPPHRKGHVIDRAGDFGDPCALCSVQQRSV